MKLIVLLVLMTSLILGCKNDGAAQPRVPSPEDSIRTAIEAHLAHKGTLNLQAFDTDVKQMTIQGDHATATVEFRVKGGPGAMQLTYALEKRDGTWSVSESEPVGSNFSHPGLDSTQSSSTNGAAAGHSLADTLRSFGISPAPRTDSSTRTPLTGLNGNAALSRP
jgi:hypothetical protein